MVFDDTLFGSYFDDEPLKEDSILDKLLLPKDLEFKVKYGNLEKFGKGPGEYFSVSAIDRHSGLYNRVGMFVFGKPNHENVSNAAILKVAPFEMFFNTHRDLIICEIVKRGIEELQILATTRGIRIVHSEPVSLDEAILDTTETEEKGKYEKMSPLYDRAEEMLPQILRDSGYKLLSTPNNGYSYVKNFEPIK